MHKRITSLGQFFKKYWLWFAFSLIFTFSIVTKINGLADRSLDFDEIYSVKYSSARLSNLFLARTYDPGNPPLYFWIIKIWRSVVGESEFRLRLLAVIFHLFALTVLFFEGKKHLRSGALLTTLFLFASSGIVFYFSRYNRAYSLTILLTLSVLFLLLDFLSEKKVPFSKTILAYFLALVGLYSHYSFVLYFFFLFITLLFCFRKARGSLKRLLVFTFFLFWGYFPWAVYFLANQFLPVIDWQKYNLWQVGEKWIGFDGWLAALSNGLSKTIGPVSLQIAIMIVFIILLDFFTIIIYRREKDLWKKTILLFLLISFNALMWTPLHRVFNDLRYSVYLFPFVFLGVGIIFDNLPKREWLKMLLFFLFIPYGLLSYKSYLDSIKTEQFRELGKRLPKYEEEALLLYHPCFLAFSVDYYARSSLSSYCLFENPEKMYLKIWDRKLAETLYLISSDVDKNWGNGLVEDLFGQYQTSQESYGTLKLTVFRKE